MGESGKGNGKVKGGHNVLPVNLLPYLAKAYFQRRLGCTSLYIICDNADLVQKHFEEQVCFCIYWSFHFGKRKKL